MEEKYGSVSALYAQYSRGVEVSSSSAINLDDSLVSVCS